MQGHGVCKGEIPKARFVSAAILNHLPGFSENSCHIRNIPVSVVGAKGRLESRVEPHAAGTLRIGDHYVVGLASEPHSIDETGDDVFGTFDPGDRELIEESRICLVDCRDE